MQLNLLPSYAIDVRRVNVHRLFNFFNRLSEYKDCDIARDSTDDVIDLIQFRRSIVIDENFFVIRVDLVGKSSKILAIY